MPKTTLLSLVASLALLLALTLLVACGSSGGGGGTPAAGSSGNDSGSSQANTVVIEYSYACSDCVDGFRVYYADNAQMTGQQELTASSPLAASARQFEFDRDLLSDDTSQVYYFVVEAYSGQQTAPSSQGCFSLDTDMMACP